MRFALFSVSTDFYIDIVDKAKLYLVLQNRHLVCDRVPKILSCRTSLFGV